MTGFTITPLKIALCFAAALLTTCVVRFILGNRRDLWFKRSQPKFILTVRGKIGDYLALGYPKTIQGLIILCALLLVLCAEIWLILKFV